MQQIVTVFETTRLVAGEWNTAYADAAFEIYGDPEVTRFMASSGVESIDEMRKRIDFIIERNKKYADGMGSFPVFLKSTGTLVGTALIKPLPDTSGNFTDEIEVGWHLARRQWGRGYATEYSKKLFEIGFDELGLDELHAVIDPPNENSIKVARRLQMKHLGTTTKYYEGDPIEHFLMTKEMFEGMR